MDQKLTRIRRLYAAQLTVKHRLKLIIPNDDQSDSTFELFINEMLNQLNRKLLKQNEDLVNEINIHSPLFIQRKQLQKDLDDFHLLNQRKDFGQIQQLIQRIEHMQNFTQKHDFNPKKSIQISSSSTTICSYQILCKELLDRLNWPLDLFASEYDRCFCQQCYPITRSNVYQGNIQNKYPMIIPRNWMKFGLKIDEVQAKIHQIWDKWAISYHGTSPNAALSMVKHRQICLPGDRLFDGTQLSIRPGHIPNQNAFFTSPTIRYAAQNHYASPLEFTSYTDKCTYTGKIVLRCRQMPETFSIQSQTLNRCQSTGNEFCDLVSDEEIEWKTDQRGTVIFDGLCIQVKQISNSFIGLNHLQQTN